MIYSNNQYNYKYKCLHLLKTFIIVYIQRIKIRISVHKFNATKYIYLFEIHQNVEICVC